MQTLSALLLVLSSLCFAQTNPRTDGATAAVLEAFKTHDIVMLGEIHNNKQEYEWLDALVADPEFADLVDDVVVELGNSEIRCIRSLWIDTLPGKQFPSPTCNAPGAAHLAWVLRHQFTATYIKWFVKQTCDVEASIRCEFSAAIRT
jgi:hypothetical protein